MQKRCVICGARFEVDRAHCRQKTCSDQCRRARLGRGPALPTNRVCGVCGVSILPVTNKKYCAECAVVQNVWANRRRYDAKPKQCLSCGESFKAHGSETTCSLKCRAALRQARKVASDRRYRESHPEKIKARSKIYRESHREEIEKIRRQRHARDPERNRECQRRYRERNREKILRARAARLKERLEYNKRWSAANRERLLMLRRLRRLDPDCRERANAQNRAYKLKHRRPLQRRSCHWCGAIFQSRHAQKRTCSASCSVAIKREKARERARQRWAADPVASRESSLRNYWKNVEVNRAKARERARRKRNTQPKGCIICGSEFWPLGNVITCSPKCRAMRSRAINRLWRLEHPDRVRLWKARDRVNNREKILARSRRRYLSADKELLREQGRRWRALHPEARTAISQRHKDKLKAMRDHLRKLGLVVKGEPDEMGIVYAFWKLGNPNRKDGLLC